MAYYLTAAENIGVARPSKLEDLLSVRAAAMLAHLYTGIAKLPQGYQALILCWVG